MFYLVILLTLAAVVVLTATVLVGNGKGGEMPPMLQDRPGPDLLGVQLDATELRSVRFAVVPRGYDMAQVDAVLDLVARQLESSQQLQDLMAPFGTGMNDSAQSISLTDERPSPQEQLVDEPNPAVIPTHSTVESNIDGQNAE